MGEIVLSIARKSHEMIALIHYTVVSVDFNPDRTLHTAITPGILGVCIPWTGLQDWITGLDYWTIIILYKMHNNDVITTCPPSCFAERNGYY